MLANATVVLSPCQLSRNVDDETVIFDLGAGMYFSPRGVGWRIWELIQQSRTVGELRDTFVQEYKVSAEECERDLQELLQDLATRGLIEIRNP